mgnify:CR=1 FL=1
MSKEGERYAAELTRLEAKRKELEDKTIEGSIENE